jgi:ABC-type transport system involved in multi-copper enzyme maturation permease subunit
MISQWCGQILAIVRLELKKTFFSRRGVWVYLLALAPILISAGRSARVSQDREHLAEVAAAHPLSGDRLRSIEHGSTRFQVEQAFGEPYARRRMYRRIGGRRIREIDFDSYTDGTTEFVLRFDDGALTSVDETERGTLGQDSVIFATMFQSFYLRLAIFFGCVGIFTNLFRGEMLDKSLHYYLLAPVRREVLLAGKYLAGLAATVVIFTTSTALQLLAMFWHFDNQALGDYLRGPGAGHIASYLGVTVLACVGYGSVFLAAGLLFRNPIIPAATVLVWEGANVFLPVALKKVSLIFYLESLCPVVAPSNQDIPGPLRLLISAAEPATAIVAVSSVLILSLLVLGIASFGARKLEINYGTD